MQVVGFMLVLFSSLFFSNFIFIYSLTVSKLLINPDFILFFFPIFISEY